MNSDLRNGASEDQWASHTEKEAEYRSLIDNMSDGFAMLEVIRDAENKPYDVRSLEVNKAYEKHSGVKPEQLVGRKWSEFDIEPRWFERVFRVAETGEAEMHEDYSALRNKFFEASFFKPAEDRVGVIFRDVTERKRVEEAVDRERARNELLADVASKLLEYDDPQRVIDELALRTMRFLDCDVFFNYLADEGRGGITLNTYAGVPEDEVEKMRHLDLGAAVCGRVAQGGKSIIIGDILASDDDRTSFHRSQGMQAYACHPLNVSGVTLGTLSFGTKKRTNFDGDDLSVMKSVADQFALAMGRIIDNRALKGSEERFRSVLDSSLDAIYRFNLRTERYEYVSPSFERVLGHSAEEMLAKSIDMAMALIHPDDVPGVSVALARLSEHGESEYDYRLREKSGGYRWISNHLSLVRDSAGRPLYRDGTIRNITERKRYEEEIERSNEELQQFAYVASHDLQEPLRMVTTYVELLEKKFGTELGPQAKQYMRFAVDGSMRMKELIGDLLAYSRIDSQSIVLEEIDMNDKVRKVVQDLHVAIEEAGAELVVDPLPTVRGDRTQIKQLVTNLISNAIKFRSEARPRVEVSCSEVGNDFVFSVQDNGIGIDPKYSDKLFKMFSRLHTKEEYPGTGIGLAIAKKIVERHNGRMWFESQPGKGTTFYFTLPSSSSDATSSGRSD